MTLRHEFPTPGPAVDLAEMFGGWRVAAASAAACAVVGVGIGFATPDDAALALGFEEDAELELTVGFGWDAEQFFDDEGAFGEAG